MRYAYFALILIAILAISIPASLASTDIPDWIRQTALLYGEGTISDDTFLGAIQYLVNEGLLKVDAPTEPEPNPDHVIPAACDTLCSVKEPDNKMACWASCSLLNFEFEFEEELSNVVPDDIFELEVISCSDFTPDSVKVEYSVTSNSEHPVTLELAVKGVDINDKVLSISTPLLDIAPGQTKYDYTFIDSYPDLDSCAIGINDVWN